MDYNRWTENGRAHQNIDFLPNMSCHPFFFQIDVIAKIWITINRNNFDINFEVEGLTHLNFDINFEHK